MDSREYASSRCLAPNFCSHLGSDSEQPPWSLDPALPAEPYSSTTSRVGYTSRRLEPLPLVANLAVLPQTSDPALSQSPSHTEWICSGSDWSFGTCWSDGEPPGLGTLSSQRAQPLVPSPSSCLSEYSNETIYDSTWVTGHSSYHAELPSWEMGPFEFATDLSLDTQSYNLSTSDITDDITFSESVDLGGWGDFRYHCDWTGELDDPTRLRRVPDTLTAGSASHAQFPTKPHVCPLVECSRQFLHQSDLFRHQRTVHMRQESGQGYRCAFEACSKADKIWTRLDSFKQHIVRQHQSADVQEIIKQSARSGSGADAYFPFAVTTPTMMSSRRRD